MNLTEFGHKHFEKGFLDLDRLLFSFLLALEVSGKHRFMPSFLSGFKLLKHILLQTSLYYRTMSISD